MVRRFFRNWTKTKSIVSVLVLCLVVFGGYFVHHRLTAKAYNQTTKQVVNSIDDLKLMAGGSIDPSADAGSKSNPFLILEIVPYAGQAEIGYLIDGCEPVASKNKVQYYGTSSFTRSQVTTLFEEEYDRLKTKAESEEAAGTTSDFDKDNWKYQTAGSNTVTYRGYYEKVEKGEYGNYQLTGYELDTSGVMSKTDDAGNSLPIYRPIFKEVSGGVKNGYNWVTVNDQDLDGIYLESLLPVTTADPNATEEPNETADPNATVDPNATQVPDVTATPKVTIDPQATVDPSMSKQDIFDALQKSQNKYVTSKTDATASNGNASYQPGQREYTTRSDSYVNGYYEKVKSGSGDFVISGYYQDDSNIFTAKDEEGNALPIYRPTFSKAADGKGDFIWVSLGTDFGSSKLQSYTALEGKYTTSEDGTISYDLGDREYTSRSLKNEAYYSEQDIWGDKGYYVHLNDFLRTSLDLDDRTEESLDNFYLAVKTITPEELAKTPEWIDYADLMYMHHGGLSIGKFTELWTKSADYGQEAKDGLVKRIAYTENGSSMSGKFNSDNDFSWQVAKKLFFKANQLDEYDGDHTYGFAPLLFSVSALDNLNGVPNNGNDIYKANSIKTVDHYHLDYRVMESYKTILNNAELKDYRTNETTDKAYNGAGTNCNIYKFMVMNFFMKQENFYNYFFQNKRYTTGTTVITDDSTGTKGLCTPQDGSEAQEYWNIDAFLPIADESYTNVSAAKCEQYGINKYGGAYLNLERPSLLGATFIYNSDSLLSQAFNTDAIANNSKTKDAFDWYLDEYGDDYTSMSPAQMIHYLLKYKKHGNSDDDESTRDKDTLHVLEIEPCADFVVDDTFLYNYLPKSKFSGSIEIDHMTTQEFNGYKSDINGVYDVIYIGVSDGKFNKSSGYTIYNDGNRDRKVYLHVGDSSGSDDAKLRSSGSDISTLKKEQLQNFVKGGNVVVLADALSNKPSSETYTELVDKSSNMHKFINSLKTSGEISVSNVCALKKLSYEFLYKNTWMYSTNVYNLPKKGSTSLSQTEYTEFKKKYSSYAGKKYKITSTPKTYKSTTDDDGKVTGDTLDSTTLDFSFVIGDMDTSHKYAVRIYMDTDYDGIITDNSKKSELVYDSNESGTTYSYSTENATDANGTPYTDKYGKALQVPVTYTVSFNFAKYYKNRNMTGRQNGSLVWKVEVYRVGNKKEYISKTGTSRYYNSQQTINNTINALQVVADGDMDSKTVLDTTTKSNQSFISLSQNLKDYDITVKTVSLSDMIAGVTNSETADSYFDAYTMVIISCGTAVQNSGEDVVNAVNQLAKDGVSVIYTGETVSKSSSADASVTASIKDILNMSRFTDSDDTYLDTNEFNNSKDKGTYKSIEYTYAAVMEEGSGKYGVFNWKNDKVKYGDTIAKATKISQSNSGGLTTYPYTISDTIDISGTKAQDFQLNMDNPNLTVWYTLGGLASTEADNSLYGISPKDATNNYYLYSVDNIGYIGIDLKESSSEEEMKLFVNTLVGISGYKYPYVNVTAVKSADSNKKDGTVTLIDSLTNTETGQYYFEGELPTGDENYLDYDTGDSTGSGKDDTGESTEEEAPADETPEPTVAPTKEPATPEPTPTPIPTATPIALPDPVTIKDDGGAQVGYAEKEDASLYAGFTDDAVVRITYDVTTVKSWGYDMPKDYQIIVEVNGCKAYVYYDIEDTANGVITCTIKKMREAEGGDSDKKSATIYKVGVYLSPYRGDLTIFDSMVLYANEDQMNEYVANGSKNKNDKSEGGGGVDDSGTTNDEIANADQDNTLVSQLKRTDVFGTNFQPDAATHKVYFTPYDGNVTMGNIRSLKITQVDKTDKDATETDPVITRKTIRKIYRDVTDSVGQHTWMYQASSDGTFTIKNLNFVQDSLEYYFFYDDHFAEKAPYYYAYKEDGVTSRSTEYHYVKFEISNRKKTGTTYLNMYYGGTPDSTYVFKLD